MNALSKFCVYTEDVNPYSQSFAHAIASLISEYSTTGSMGPKVSSCMISIFCVTQSKTVGSKKYPFVPILWPPHSSLAPCWIALSTFFSIDSNALASISGPISRSATSLGFPTFTCFMPATSFSMKVSFIALST